jgi:hypothetical protein
VTILPRYKKDSTCSISFPFIDNLCSISELILISLVLLTFIWSPASSASQCSLTSFISISLYL